MRNLLIEQYNSSRHNINLAMLLGWTTWYGIFIMKEFIINRYIFGILTLAGLIGWAFFTINLFRLLQLSKQINQNPALRAALNDELIRHYRLLSFRAAYIIVMITICIMVAITTFFQLPAMLLFKIMLYIGVLSFVVPFIIYNRS